MADVKAMINTYNLFTVQVRHCKFPIPIELHKKIFSFVEKNMSISDINFSNIQGYQNHGDFEGKKELEILLENYFNNIYGLKLDYGWLNVLTNDSYNKPHTHPSTGVTDSAVLYLSSENSNINFTKDSEVVEIKPKMFDLLIFPYNLLHYVLPEKRREKRISYAMNLKNIV